MLLVDLSARATLILIAALLATLTMRRAAAATRHLAWTLAIAAVLALPVLMIFVPQWEVLPSIGRAEALPHTASVPPDSHESNKLHHDGASPLNSVAQPFTAAALKELALGMWAIGTFALLARMLAGIRAVRRLARHARPADSPRRDVLAQIAAAAGVTRHIRLLTSADVAMPMTWGSMKPIVLLPDDAHTWGEDRLRVVLLHEVAHIRRADSFTQALCRIAVACHWFNPFAWIAARAMEREREQACDDSVVAAGSPAADYAQHLLDIARAAPAAHLSVVATAMATHTHLEHRLVSILTPHRRCAGRLIGPAMALAAVVGTMCIAAARPAAAPRRTPEQTPAAARRTPLSTVTAEQMTADRDEGRQRRAARDTLVGALDDPSDDVREKAALALALQSEGDVVAPLLRALDDPSAQVREKAALGLSFRREPRVVDALLRAASDPDAQVREKVMFALGLSRDGRAIEALTAGTRDPDEQVREKAILGLALTRR